MTRVGSQRHSQKTNKQTNKSWVYNFRTVMVYDIGFENTFGEPKFSIFFTAYRQLHSLLFKMFDAYHFDNTQRVRVTTGIENINNNFYFQDKGLPGCCVG